MSYSKVITSGNRVLEQDGKPAMCNRNPSDGGGLKDEPAARKLAKEINERRAKSAALRQINEKA